MSSPFTGILTAVGASNILGATGNGGTINVTSFAVSAIGGTLDPSRVTTNSTWYTGAFNPVATINNNTIKVTMVIPPTSPQVPLTDNTPMAELYLFANVNGGEQFLLGIIHPPDNTPIIYSNIVEYDIILEVQFNEENITGVFNFIYNSGDVGAHDLNPSAHQKRWVLKTGDVMTGALHEAMPTTKASVNGILSLDETSNSFVVTGAEPITVIDTWTTGIAKIRWNTSRTLTNSSTLQLITGANRVTQIGDVGVYELTPTGCREISYFPKTGYVNRAGDNVLGNIVFNNNTIMQGKDTSGNIDNIAFIDFENIEQIGSINLPLNFNSNADPTALINGAPQTMYHTGNLKVSNLPSYCVNAGNVNTHGVGSLLYSRNPLDSSTVNFKIGTTEYYADYNYSYINRAGAGATTIGYVNNIYSLNGTNQYLTAPKMSTLGADTWSIQRKIKFNASGTNEGIMGNGTTGSSFGVSLQRQITSDKLILKLSSNGTSFDIADGTTILKGLGSNAFNNTSNYYWIKVYFNGNAYKVDYSLDGLVWVNDIQISSPSKVYLDISQLCLGTNGTYFLNGSEDMSGAKFILNNNAVFEGNLVYAAPNITVTFSNNSSYVISSIADITNLIDDGPYKIILEENNLIKLGDGTYHAIPTAVKINYSFTGKLPNIYSAVSPGGYDTSYVGIKGLNSYNLFNGSGTGIYWMSQSSYYPIDTGGVSTFILNMDTLKTISSVSIQSRAVSNSTNLYTHTHYANRVYMSFSVDNGITYGTRTLYTMSPGLNTIDIPNTSANNIKFEFPSVGDVNVGGSHGHYYDVWWVGLSIGSISVVETVNYAGGNIVEDYALSASTSTINYTPTAQSPIMTSTNNGGINAKIINAYGAVVVNNNPYQLFDSDNSTSVVFAGGDQGYSYYLLLSKTDNTPFIMTSMYLYSTAGGGAYNTGGTDGGWLYGSNNTTNGNDGTWTLVKIINSGAGGVTYDLNNITSYITYKFVPSVSLYGGYSNGSTHYEEINFEYTTAYSSNSSNVGDYFLNLSNKPHKPMKNTNILGWVETQFIKLGEVSKVGGILGTPITYAYNGTSFYTIKCPVYDTTTVIPHNIGIDEVVTNAYLINTKSQFGYSVGQRAVPMAASSSEGSDPIGTSDINTVTFSTGNEGASGLQIMKKDNTGVYGSPTVANWKLKVITKRNF